MTELNEKIKFLDEHSVIAISGFGGAGKTTLANKLAAQINAQIVHVDDFVLTNSSGLNKFSFWNMMNFTRLENEVLKPYKNKQQTISYGKFDWDKNEININLEIKSNSRLIIEGVGLLRPEFIKYFDFSIWVDCNIEEAIQRGIKRDVVFGNNHDALWNGLWKENDLQCFEQYKPMQIADFIYKN